MEIKTRWHKDGDEAQIGALFERVFDRKKETGKWEWQFLHNPAGIRGHELTRLAEADGRIIGQYCLIPARITVDGKETMAAVALDVMVDPGFRRRGLFSRLAEECYRGATGKNIDFFFALPNQNSAPGFFGHSLWHNRGVPPVSIRPALLPLPSLRRVTDENVVGFGPEFDQLWSICRRSPVTVIRDSRYLRWRYLESPFQYVRKAARVGQSLGAFCAGRVLRDRRVPVGFVTDLFGSSTVAITTALGRVCHDMRSQGASVFCVLCYPSSPYAPIFRRFGFVRLPAIFYPHPFFLAVRSAGLTGFAFARTFQNVRNWSLTWGDTDLV